MELEAFITEELDTVDVEAVLLCADLGACRCCFFVQRLEELQWQDGAGAVTASEAATQPVRQRGSQ